MDDTTYDSLLQHLTDAGQQHVLRFWSELNPSQQDRLSKQLQTLDLDFVHQLNKTNNSSPQQKDLTGRITSPPGFLLNANHPEFLPEKVRQRGEQALRDGQVGVVIVAGGQGTRLGFPHPKGMFPIGPVSGATLFQILFEKVRAISQRYQTRLPVYLMTSPATHTPTVDYLTTNQRFGLSDDEVSIFYQGVMPAIDAVSKKLLLSDRSSLCLSPDGHGGLVRALKQHGLFAEMRQRHIQQLFYLQIDNPLVPLADTDFIGYHLLSSSEATTMVVRKQDPTEKVGVAASVDDQLRIIEYSDLPLELMEKRDAKGALKLWAGNIAVHLFDVSFLERVADGLIDMPYHHAYKKVPYVDDSGNRVEPSEPNAIQFEQFIFDLLPSARQARVVEVNRQTAFAPVKNSTVTAHDSPEGVRRQMVTVYRHWLQTIGVEIADNVAVEISPLFAIDPNQLRERVTEGMSIKTDTYLQVAADDSWSGT